ncbi:unnamed protein product, partial [Bubo scandiacus]
CWRAHRQAQQNKTPGASMSSHKHRVCTAKCRCTGHRENPKQTNCYLPSQRLPLTQAGFAWSESQPDHRPIVPLGPEVGCLSLADADERGGLLYNKSSAPVVFTRRTVMFVLGGSNSSVL